MSTRCNFLRGCRSCENPYDHAYCVLKDEKEKISRKSDILTRPYKRKESDLRASLTKKFKDMKFFVQNIESGTTGVGIPDMYVECATLNMWIEVKTCAEPKRATTGIKPDWRPGQLAWAENYLEHDGVGRWFLIIQVGKNILYTWFPREEYERNKLLPLEELFVEISCRKR